MVVVVVALLLDGGLVMMVIWCAQIVVYLGMVIAWRQRSVVILDGLWRTSAFFDEEI